MPVVQRTRHPHKMPPAPAPRCRARGGRSDVGGVRAVVVRVLLPVPHLELLEEEVDRVVGDAEDGGVDGAAARPAGLHGAIAARPRPQARAQRHRRRRARESSIAARAYVCVSRVSRASVVVCASLSRAAFG